MISLETQHLGRVLPQSEQIRAAIRLAAEEAKSLMVAISLDIQHLEVMKARAGMVDEAFMEKLLEHQQARLDEHRRELTELYQDTLKLMFSYVAR